MKLVGLYAGAGAHPAGWRMPDAIPAADVDFQHYTHVAQMAERGKMDALIFHDCAAVPESGPRADVVRLEPVEMIPALAMLTAHVGLVASSSTTYGAPYHVARRYATLDHISNGRAGWHLVTSETVDEALNFGRTAEADAASCHARAAEFFNICAGLWDSWDADSVLRDKTTGHYYDPAKVHVLNHKGRFFSVRGPLNVARCPQGRPVVIQSDPSARGLDLAAQTADVLITEPGTLDEARAVADDVRRRCAGLSRARDALKILLRVMPVVGRTDEEARQYYAKLQSLDNHSDETEPAVHIVCGSPRTLADMLQMWFETEVTDGFAIAFPYYPKPVEDFVELVIPELQRRGLFRNGYNTATLRGHLELRIPDSDYDQSAMRART